MGRCVGRRDGHIMAFRLILYFICNALAMQAAGRCCSFSGKILPKMVIRL